MSGRPAWLTLLCGGLCLLCAAGCRSAPTSTRMTGGDLELVSEELAASLAASDALADRTPQSQLWVISIEKVLNLTADVMTESEQWTVMARIRSSLPIQKLWDTKNVRFVIPAERARHLAQGDLGAEAPGRFGRDRTPTHLMTATFRSVTRASAKGRMDLYYCEFNLLGLERGEPVWSDRFEYKRTAGGHLLD